MGPSELMAVSDVFTSGPPTKGVTAVLAHFWLVFSVAFSHFSLVPPPFKESIRQRFKESGEVLKCKAEEKLDKLMEGSGYKTPRYGSSLQLRMGVDSYTNHRGKKKTSSSRKRKTRKRKSNSSEKRQLKRK